MQDIVFTPIGVIHSPFVEREGTPIQPAAAKGVKGTVEVRAEFAEGLCDLDGFSHIVLLYHFHKSKGFSLKVKPFLDKVLRGVFATRAPKRPNGVGLSVVRLVRIEGLTLHVENVDVLDGAPLIDIKPYVPEFDTPEDVRLGWLDGLKPERLEKTKADGRFG